MATEKRLDLVEREAVKNAIGFMNLHFLGHGESKSVLDSINDVPSVDAAPVVHGRWIHTAIEDDNWGGTFHEWTCSNCDFSTGHNPNGTNYCPNCGAKMDGERKDNDSRT